MTESTTKPTSADPFKPETIDLRDPWLAAFLGWLVPGLGHMYQRRWGKGGLFMVCILGTFFYGLSIGGGRVVYASFREPDFREWRLHYLAQVGVGLPALPAAIQAIRTNASPPKAPLFDGFMAPPMRYGQQVPRDWVAHQHRLEVESGVKPHLYEYAPEYLGGTEAFQREQPYLPYVAGAGGSTDQFGIWNLKHGGYYDLGTVFTMIAGLLNLLAIWDAWGGPMVFEPKPASKKEPSPDEKK